MFHFPICYCGKSCADPDLPKTTPSPPTTGKQAELEQTTGKEALGVVQKRRRRLSLNTDAAFGRLLRAKCGRAVLSCGLVGWVVRTVWSLWLWRVSIGKNSCESARLTTTAGQRSPLTAGVAPVVRRPKYQFLFSVFSCAFCFVSKPFPSRQRFPSFSTKTISHIDLRSPSQMLFAPADPSRFARSFQNVSAKVSKSPRRSTMRFQPSLKRWTRILPPPPPTHRLG